MNEKKEFGSLFGAIAWLYRLPLPLLAKAGVKVVVEVTYTPVEK